MDGQQQKFDASGTLFVVAVETPQVVPCSGTTHQLVQQGVVALFALNVLVIFALALAGVGAISNKEKENIELILLAGGCQTVMFFAFTG